jgi:hypothetical protein
LGVDIAATVMSGGSEMAAMGGWDIWIMVVMQDKQNRWPRKHQGVGTVRFDDFHF